MTMLYIEVGAKQILETMQTNGLPHALLLFGPHGVGLNTIAKSLANGPIAAYLEPMLLTKTSSTAQIGIEMVRELYDITRSVTSDTYIIIDDTDTMTLSAQNSLLKLLEEPHPKIHFILTSHRPESLLPTIQSRVQRVHLPVVDEQTYRPLLENLPEQTRQRITFIAHGLPAEIIRLREDYSYYEHMVELTKKAKQCIESSQYEAMVLIMSGNTERASILKLIERMVYLLQISPDQRSLTRIDTLLNAHTSIRRGGNPKLQLIASML